MNLSAGSKLGPYESVAPLGVDSIAKSFAHATSA
jgi:hypothetical protein